MRLRESRASELHFHPLRSRIHRAMDALPELQRKSRPICDPRFRNFACLNLPFLKSHCHIASFLISRFTVTNLLLSTASVLHGPLRPAPLLNRMPVPLTRQSLLGN